MFFQLCDHCDRQLLTEEEFAEIAEKKVDEVVVQFNGYEAVQKRKNHDTKRLEKNWSEYYRTNFKIKKNHC